MDFDFLKSVRDQVSPDDFADPRTRSFVIGCAMVAVPEGSKSASLIGDCETYVDFIQAVDLLLSVAAIGPVAA